VRPARFGKATVESPNPLQQLFARYRALEAHDSSQLTDDEERSMRFYRAEQQLRRTTEPLDSTVDQVHAWVRNVLDLELFVARNYQLPRVNRRRAPAADPVERRLEQWLNYQTRPGTISRHCSYQTDRLAIIPGYSATRLDDQWQARYDQYRTFLAGNRRAPALRSTDPAEKALANWAAKQRFRRRNESLTAHRAAALSRLKMWTWSAPRKKSD
jgi:hypothetical protein